MYLFPRAAVTNYPYLGDLKQLKLMLSQAESQKSEIKTLFQGCFLLVAL
jgi:hypothetical protein